MALVCCSSLLFVLGYYNISGSYALAYIDGQSLRQHGIFHFVFVFALAERKNEKQLDNKVPLCRRLIRLLRKSYKFKDVPWLSAF